MVLKQVQNVGELLCDCGFNGLHDHCECSSGAWCAKCGVKTYYSSYKPSLVRDGDDVNFAFICPFCGSNGSQDVSTWNNVGVANEMYPRGCECQNNGDYCDYCDVILDEWWCDSD